MSLDPGIAAAAAATGLGALVAGAGAAAALASRRLSSKQLGVDFEFRERAVLQSVEEATSAQSVPDQITYDDLEHGNMRDHELREVVAKLARRMKRMETVSERLEVRRQVLLETYHNQGLSQSRVSFGFSLFLGLLGFSVIVYAVLTRSQQAATYISGAVTEAVSALFFTQSNQARRLMAQFFDKLRDDRRLEESLKLTEGIENAQLKSSLQALVAMQLIDSKVSPSVLPGFHPEGNQGLPPNDVEVRPST